MKPASKKRRFSILLLSPILAASFMVGFIAAITGEKHENLRNAKKEQPTQQALESTYNFDMELIIPEEDEPQVITHQQQ